MKNNMKMRFLFLILMLLPVVAKAYDAYINGIYYNLSGNKATVTYKNTSHNSYSGDVVIPNSVTHNGIRYTVTSIGNSAFRDCLWLTSIIIPNSVISIGSSAFYSCSNLASITIPNSVTSIGSSAFYGTAWYNNMPDGLVYAGKVAYEYKGTMAAGTQIIIQEGTLGIAERAFSYRTLLKSISIPNSVISIGKNAFYGCNLTSIKIATENAVYDSRNDCNAIIETETNTLIVGCQNTSIPKSVISIGSNAFSGCRSLKSITIPNSVTNVGSSAFSDCNNLTSIIIPNSVISIGSSAFSNCSNLTSITIPNSVTSIGFQTFYYCSSLTSITIPNSVTSIENSAFFGCLSLTSITIPSSVANIGRSAFDGTAWYNNMPDGLVYAGKVAYKYKGNMAADTQIIIQEGTLGIAEEAFMNCRGLKSITIPNSVISIGRNAFSGTVWYDNLPDGLVYAGKVAYKYKGNMATGTHIIIQKGTLGIAVDAFSGCRGMISINIPNSVTNIGSSAFSGCSNLSWIRVEKHIPFDIDQYTLPYRSNTTLYVPSGSKAVYEVTNYWENFKKIVECPDPDVNQDNKVNVVDVVDIARFTVGLITVAGNDSFIEFIADINSDDTVNLADAVVLVNEITGDQNFVKGWSAPTGTDTYDALSLAEKDGCLSLNLENKRSYTAFQFELYVPEGTDVSKMLLNSERKQKHQLLYNKIENGHYRVAALSTSNNEFNGNSGELLNISLVGGNNCEVSIRNIKFFDAMGQEYQFEDIEGAVATGIKDLPPAVSQGEGYIYNLQGHKRESLQRGVNIVGEKKIIVK